MSGTGLFLKVKITAADLNRILAEAIHAGIVFEDIVHIDEVSILCKIHLRNYSRVKEIFSSASAEVKVIGKTGLLWNCLTIMQRPVLILGFIILCFLTGCLPTKILFVKVEGNTQLPTNIIYESAEKCGIRFGANRSFVRSEKVKNSLLEELPQLQWAGINTTGCVATITVKERAFTEQNSNELVFGNIVSNMDGIIVECTVEKGELQCSVGQAVRNGQVLVSGYKDNGISISATQPIAEIFAMTFRNLSTITPDVSGIREKRKSVDVNYYFQIGEKYIIFNNSSRIYDTTCVKMYDKKSLQLPGGFELPIAIIKETREYYSLTVPNEDYEQNIDWLANSQMQYLNDQMIAGRVVSSANRLEYQTGYICLRGQYRCIEMIGQFKQEEILH